MYVGPWQELQLSKLQRYKAPAAAPTVHSSNNSNETLKSIENTIVNSLDYAQARLLLDKLGPLLSSSSGAATLLPTLPIQSAINNVHTSGNGTFYDPFHDTSHYRVAKGRRQRNLRLTQQSLLTHNQTNNNSNNNSSNSNNNVIDKRRRQLQELPLNAISKFPPVYKISPEEYGIAHEVPRGGSGSSGRISSKAMATPLSVRSSMSEPIYGKGKGAVHNSSSNSSSSVSMKGGGHRINRNARGGGGGEGKELPLLTSQLQLQNELLQQHLRQQQQQQYNSQNAMQLLRLERATRKAQQMPRPDLSHFWGWKSSDGTDSVFSDSEIASNGDAAGGRKQSQGTREDQAKAEKIAMVRKMQQLYISTDTGNADGITREPLQPRPPPSEGIQKSPIRSRQQQPSPRHKDAKVADMDLTETDLAAIAKYFGEAESAQQRTFSDSPDKAALVAVPVALPQRLALRLPPHIFSDDLPDEPSPLPSPTHDELYTAGGDGLLNWSSNLHLDDL